MYLRPARGQSWLYWTSLIYQLEFPKGCLVSDTRFICKAQCVSDFVPYKLLIQSIQDMYAAHTTGGGPFDLWGSPFDVE